MVGAFVPLTRSARETSTLALAGAATGFRTCGIQGSMAEMLWSKPVMPEATLSQADGLWIIDAEGKTVFANAAMARILGTTAADLSGQDSFVYVFPEDLP